MKIIGRSNFWADQVWWEHSHAYLLKIVPGSFLTTAPELSGHHRELQLAKPKIFIIWFFMEKIATPCFSDEHSLEQTKRLGNYRGPDPGESY